MKQGREARVCHETAEGLRKPESGTAAEVDDTAVNGADPGDAVKGRRTSWESAPAREGRTAGRT